MMNEQRRSRLPFGLGHIFYGWWIVFACFIIGLYTGGIIFYGFTAFIDPLVREFGWSYTQVSFALSLRGIEMSFLSPLVGFLVDRYGPRRLVFLGVITIGLGFGGTVVLRGAILREYFGRQAFGRLLGLVMGAAAAGGMIGPTLAGFIFDKTGSYYYTWISFGIASSVSVLLMLFIGPKPKAASPDKTVFLRQHHQKA